MPEDVSEVEKVVARGKAKVAATKAAKVTTVKKTKGATNAKAAAKAVGATTAQTTTAAKANITAAAAAAACSASKKRKLPASAGAAKTGAEYDEGDKHDEEEEKASLADDKNDEHDDEEEEEEESLACLVHWENAEAATSSSANSSSTPSGSSLPPPTVASLSTFAAAATSTSASLPSSITPSSAASASSSTTLPSTTSSTSSTSIASSFSSSSHSSSTTSATSSSTVSSVSAFGVAPPSAPLLEAAAKDAAKVEVKATAKVTEQAKVAKAKEQAEAEAQGEATSKTSEDEQGERSNKQASDSKGTPDSKHQHLSTTPTTNVNEQQLPASRTNAAADDANASKRQQNRANAATDAADEVASKRQQNRTKNAAAEDTSDDTSKKQQRATTRTNSASEDASANNTSKKQQTRANAASEGASDDTSIEQPAGKDELPEADIELSLGKEVLHQRDRDRLRDGYFLNDNVMNFFLHLISRYIVPRDTANQVHVFSTRFFAQLISRNVSSGKEGWANVRNWTRKIDVLSYRTLLFPINEETPAGCHWWLAVVELPRGEQAGRLYLLDSIPSEEPARESFRMKVVQFLRGYLQREFEERANVEGRSNWPPLRRLPFEQSAAPLQENGCDCGVFVLELSEELMRRAGCCEELRSSTGSHALLGHAGHEHEETEDGSVTGAQAWFDQTRASARRQAMRDVSKLLLSRGRETLKRNGSGAAVADLNDMLEAALHQMQTEPNDLLATMRRLWSEPWLE